MIDPFTDLAAMCNVVREFNLLHILFNIGVVGFQNYRQSSEYEVLS